MSEFDISWSVDFSKQLGYNAMKDLEEFRAEIQAILGVAGDPELKLQPPYRDHEECIFTKVLKAKLLELPESPQKEWGRNKREIGAVVPGTVRIGETTLEGYYLEDFRKRFRIYLRSDTSPQDRDTPSQHSSSSCKDKEKSHDGGFSCVDSPQCDAPAFEWCAPM